MKKLTIGLIGNPNAGKTTLFNQLTGARQRVGNWAGVTVERKAGQFATTDNQVTLVDLPGTYSLTTISSQTSLDEQPGETNARRGGGNERPQNNRPAAKPRGREAQPAGNSAMMDALAAAMGKKR